MVVCYLILLSLISYLGTNNAGAQSIGDSIKERSNPQHMLLNPANGIICM